jgi:phosphoglycolate phosphatase-like HAD superfamily hydrolase
VLFDIDGTLISAPAAGRAAIDAAFLRLFEIESASASISFDGRTNRAIFTELLAVHGLPASAYAQVLEAYLAEIPSALKVDWGCVLPGVMPLLGQLRETHKPGLATGNTRRAAETYLCHFRLWQRFIGGGFGDQAFVRADVVRQGLVEVAALLGCDPDPSDCLVIGDTPLDIAAAHAVGARVLAVATGPFDPATLHAAGADFVVPDLTNTATLISIVAVP